MGQEEFIGQLKLALADPGVRAALVEAVREKTPAAVQIQDVQGRLAAAADENRTLKEELARLRGAEKESRERLAQMEQTLHSLEKRNGELRQKLQKTEKQLGGFVNVFGKFYSMLEAYDNLSEHTRNDLKGIFKEERPDSWIAAGVQPENIDSLWEYTRMQIMNRRYEDLEGLSLLIYYFIDLYNSTRSTPVYSLQQVRPGDLFDVDGHIRTSDSKAAGKITKVFLYGYRNTGTDLLIKRSVVMI